MISVNMLRLLTFGVLAIVRRDGSEPPRPRHSLRQSLYAMRQELGAEIIRSESILTIDPAAITSDITEFREALGQG